MTNKTSNLWPACLINVGRLTETETIQILKMIGYGNNLWSVWWIFGKIKQHLFGPIGILFPDANENELL